MDGGPVRLERLGPGGAWLYRRRLWCVVRTSRIATPFWGVKPRALELFAAEAYALLLFDSPVSGWALPRVSVEAAIRAGCWPRDKRGEYKIKAPPCAKAEACRFEDAAALRQRLDGWAALCRQPVA